MVEPIKLAMADQRIRSVELKAVLQVLYETHGYDFRSYASTSIERRLHECVKRQKLTCLADLIPRILYQPGFAQQLIPQLAVSVTNLFRDEAFFRAIREKILPILHTFPFFKIWHAGCSSGEEIYSMAIILMEEGLLSRAQIYATDINYIALQQAKEGIYSLEEVINGEERYRKSGGKCQLRDYFTTRYNAACIRAELKRHITFASHNLAVDSDFAEMQLIICRNVLIYFNNDLKKRVMQLFFNSLYPSGILCLGNKENLTQLPMHTYFHEIAASERIYKKIVNNYNIGDKHPQS